MKIVERIETVAQKPEQVPIAMTDPRYWMKSAKVVSQQMLDEKAGLTGESSIVAIEEISPKSNNGLAKKVQGKNKQEEINNAIHYAIEPPCTEPYARWCERSELKAIPTRLRGTHIWKNCCI